jgi:hypothetical protein
MHLSKHGATNDPGSKLTSARSRGSDNILLSTGRGLFNFSSGADKKFNKSLRELQNNIEEQLDDLSTHNNLFNSHYLGRNNEQNQPSLDSITSQLMQTTEKAKKFSNQHYNQEYHGIKQYHCNIRQEANQTVLSAKSRHKQKKEHKSLNSFLQAVEHNSADAKLRRAEYSQVQAKEAEIRRNKYQDVTRLVAMKLDELEGIELAKQAAQSIEQQRAQQLLQKQQQFNEYEEKRKNARLGILHVRIYNMKNLGRIFLSSSSAQSPAPLYHLCFAVEMSFYAANLSSQVLYSDYFTVSNPLLQAEFEMRVANAALQSLNVILLAVSFHQPIQNLLSKTNNPSTAPPHKIRDVGSSDRIELARFEVSIAAIRAQKQGKLMAKHCNLLSKINDKLMQQADSVSLGLLQRPSFCGDFFLEPIFNHEVKEFSLI